MKLRMILAVSTAFAGLLLSTPSQAQVVLDQDAFVAPSPTGLREIAQMGSFNVAGRAPVVNLQWGQSVTAGQTGLLSLIQVQGPFQSFNNSVPVTFSLYSGIAGQPGSGLIGSYERLAIDLPPLANINNEFGFAAFGVADFGYVVHPGDVFSFTLAFANPVPIGFTDNIVVGNVTGFSAPNVPIFAPNAYAGGTALAAAGGSNFFIAPNQPDLGFRTYVEALHGAVPEPSSWMMMIAGFGLIAGAMRRRSRVRTTVSYT